MDAALKKKAAEQRLAEDERDDRGKQLARN
jgi:hypothetical protein